jgi:hypothetical protein
MKLDEESHYCLETISESSVTKKQKTLNLKFCLLLKMDGKSLREKWKLK